MKWIKQGLIYFPNGNLSWARSHAMIPTPEIIDHKIRIYLSCCDENGVGRTGYIIVSAENPKKFWKLVSRHWLMLVCQVHLMIMVQFVLV